MEKTFHYLVMSVHLQFQKFLLANLKDTDLTSGQPKVLEYLLYHDGAVQKQIAAACHIEPATITSVLLGMKKNGLIIRKNRNNNRRSLYVYLTDKGRELAERIRSEFEIVEENALVGFSDTEKEMLTRLLARVNCNMKESNDTDE